MSVEEYWRLYSIWRPRPEDVCNSEILQLPTVQWRADAVPASGYYQNVDIPAGEFICVFSDRVYAWQPFTENGAWNINARCRSGLTLTPAPNQTPPDPRPKGTEGKDPKSSTHELIAKVTENGSPKAGVAVTFAVEPIANSGGHDHHDASRKKGTVKPNNPVTDANGEIKATFQASEFAGTETITATCDACSNKTATAPVKVKVPDLVELSADSAAPARYKLIGSTGKHAANHFFTTDAKEALKIMLSTFAEFNWGIVGVNDASLIWGGRFDIAGAWGGSHHEHRDGQEVDISFYKPGGIPPATRQKVYDDLRTAQGIATPEVLWHLQDNSGTGSKAHFHVYLLGQKASRTTPF